MAAQSFMELLVSLNYTIFIIFIMQEKYCTEENKRHKSTTLM